MSERSAEPETPSIDRDCADAYAAFWQCLDAEQPVDPSPEIGPDRNAYEQYWCCVDADWVEQCDERDHPMETGSGS